MKIDELNLFTRTYNVLLRAGVTTTEKIKEMTDDDLRNIKNMSEKCLMEVRCAVYCAEDLMTRILLGERFSVIGARGTNDQTKEEYADMGAREVAEAIADYLISDKDLIIAMLKDNDKDKLTDEIYDELTAGRI